MPRPRPRHTGPPHQQPRCLDCTIDLKMVSLVKPKGKVIELFLHDQKKMRRDRTSRYKLRASDPGDAKLWATSLREAHLHGGSPMKGAAAANGRGAVATTPNGTRVEEAAQSAEEGGGGRRAGGGGGGGGGRGGGRGRGGGGVLEACQRRLQHGDGPHLADDVGRRHDVSRSQVSSAADDLTGAKRFLCAAGEVTVCTMEGECASGPPWEFNVPDFIEVDLEAGLLKTTEASQENRQTPILDTTTNQCLVSLTYPIPCTNLYFEWNIFKRLLDASFEYLWPELHCRSPGMSWLYV